jgi:peroxiredoxin
MLAEVANSFSDVPGYRGTLSETAAAQLFELQHLAVGKIAPEIVGVDLNGGEMRLSDYRGSVVMIHFWGSWCSRCVETISGERALAEGLKDQPFVMLGVNNDEQVEMALRFADEHKMDWSSWFDGAATTGAIATKWNIIDWPTSYVLDHQGVIRAKFLGAITPEVETLVRHLTASVPQSDNTRYVWKILLGGGIGCIAVGLVLHWRNRIPEAVRL